jgi:hypothetical protein
MDDLCFHTQQTLLMVATRKRRWPGVDTASFQVLEFTVILVVLGEFKTVQHELVINQVFFLRKGVCMVLLF